MSMDPTDGRALLQRVRVVSILKNIYSEWIHTGIALAIVQDLRQFGLCLHLYSRTESLVFDESPFQFLLPF